MAPGRRLPQDRGPGDDGDLPPLGVGHRPQLGPLGDGRLGLSLGRPRPRRAHRRDPRLQPQGRRRARHDPCTRRAPDWAHDRAALWNAVEAVEARKDAQVAREITVALPAELSAADRHALVEDWVRSELVDRGMIADVAFHAPHREGDQRNHHAHILLTMRGVGPDGFGPKVREWNGKDQLGAWRESWAAAQNRALERAEIEARVDHRGLVAQGRQDLPTRHLGPAATALERQEAREAAEVGREIEPVTEAGRWNAFARECNDALRQAQELARGARKALGTLVRQAGSLAEQLGDFLRSPGAEALAQGLWERSAEGRAELRRQELEAQAKERHEARERSPKKREQDRDDGSERRSPQDRGWSR